MLAKNVGAAICAIGAFENALYDGKFIFLWLWVLVLPLMNLLLLVFKPEKRVKTKGAKVAFLGAGIAVNLLFGVLLWAFEAVSPDFIVHVGKPLFAIAFSVSLPIEMLGLACWQSAECAALCWEFAFAWRCLRRKRERNKP